MPLYFYDEQGSEYFSLNETLEVEQMSLKEFKKLNIENQENVLMPEGLRRLGNYPVRRFQKRRRRRLNLVEE
jgi:hypothetical protein